jgi:transcriptional regulator with XRE-family HTH domain
MKSHSNLLGKLIQKQRFEYKKLTRRELAKMLGYSNLGRGIWQIEQIENGKMEKPLDTLVSRICEILEIPELDRKRCEFEEKKLLLEYRKTLSPFKPHISVRLGSCFGNNYAIPEEIRGVDGYISYSIGLAKTIKQTVRLWINRDLSYVVEPEGKYIIDRKYHGAES